MARGSGLLEIATVDEAFGAVPLNGGRARRAVAGYAFMALCVARKAAVHEELMAGAHLVGGAGIVFCGHAAVDRSFSYFLLLGARGRERAGAQRGERDEEGEVLQSLFLGPSHSLSGIRQRSTKPAGQSMAISWAQLEPSAATQV